MKVPCLILGQCLALSAFWAGWVPKSTNVLSQGLQGATRGLTRLEDFERRIGPLEMIGQRFTIVLFSKRLLDGGALNPDSQETVVRLEIRGAAGRVDYQKTFPYQAVGNAFEGTTDVSAQVLEGTQSAGILLTYGALPSTPLGGESWQVFGLWNGKLVPFSKRIFAEGQLINGRQGENVVKTSKEPNFQPDVLHFRVWAGNFFLIVPVRVDWFLAKASLAWRCVTLTPSVSKPLCEYRVETERVPLDADMTFVRLHVEATEGLGIADHIVVKRDSKIEFLAAEAEVIWQEGADAVELSVSEDPWLKVRIDGKEGWIHTQEDFQAIGIPEAH